MTRRTAIPCKLLTLFLAALLFSPLGVIPAQADTTPGDLSIEISPDMVTPNAQIEATIRFTPAVEFQSGEVKMASPDSRISGGQALVFQFCDEVSGSKDDLGVAHLPLDEAIGPDHTLVLHVHFTLQKAIEAGDTIHLTTTFDMVLPGGEPAEPFSQETDIPVSAGSPLSINVRPDRDTVSAGGTLTYTFRAQNPNDATARNVKVTDTFDPNLTPINIEPIGGPVVSGNALTWDLRDFSSHDSWSGSVTFQVDASAPNGYQLQNSAEITSDNIDSNRDTAPDVQVVNAPPQPYKLSIAADQSQVSPGGLFRYTITFQNSDQATVVQPSIQLPIPTGTRFVRASDYGSPNGNTVIWFLDSIAPSAQVSVTVDLTVRPDAQAGSSIVGVASFTGQVATPGAQPINISAQASPVSVSAPALSLSHTVAPGNAPAGGSVTFTIVAKNISAGSASNCSLEYTVNSRLVSLAFNPSPTGQTGNVYSWSLGMINAGQQVQVTINAQIDAGTAKGLTLTNYAKLTGNGPSYSASAGVYVSETAPPEPTDFPDVPSYFWAYDPIMALVRSQVINGYPDGTFQPANNVTRAEFSKMILLAIGYAPPPVAAGATPVFPDLTADDMWANSFIMGAVDHGLMKGYPDGTFRPRNPITMAEVLTVIARAQQWPSVDLAPGTNLWIHDLDNAGPPGYVVRRMTTDEWYYGSVAAAIAHHVLNLPDDPHLTIPGPEPNSDMAYFNSPSNRAQTAVFLYRMQAVLAGEVP